jgi:hypothetical protein
MKRNTYCAGVPAGAGLQQKRPGYLNFRYPATADVAVDDSGYTVSLVPQTGWKSG